METGIKKAFDIADSIVDKLPAGKIKEKAIELTARKDLAPVKGVQLPGIIDKAITHVEKAIPFVEKARPFVERVVTSKKMGLDRLLDAGSN